MLDHYRTPTVLNCEYCKNDYITFYNKKTRRFCSLKCFGKHHTQSRLDNNIKYRDEERKMWRKYWYYDNLGVKSPDEIADQIDADNFRTCRKDFLTTKYTSIKA